MALNDIPDLLCLAQHVELHLVNLMPRSSEMGPRNLRCNMLAIRDLMREVGGQLQPAYPSCGKPLRVTRITPRSGGRTDLRTNGCQQSRRIAGFDVGPPVAFPLYDLRHCAALVLETLTFARVLPIVPSDSVQSAIRLVCMPADIQAKLTNRRRSKDHRRIGIVHLNLRDPP
jgi:hypothetical protein